MTDKLPINVDSLESIPEAIQSFYTQSEDGKFTLAIDGQVADNSKIAEFRNTNIQLKQERDALQTQLDALANKIAPEQTQDKKDIQPTDRLAAMETKFAELTKQLESKESALAQKTKEDQIRSAATELGIPATAHIDIINRVMGVDHKLENDKLVFESLVNDDGSVFTVKDLLDKELRKVAPHFFIQKTGTGADPKAKTVVENFVNDKKTITSSTDLFKNIKF